MATIGLVFILIEIAFFALFASVYFSGVAVAAAAVTGFATMVRNHNAQYTQDGLNWINRALMVC